MIQLRDILLLIFLSLFFTGIIYGVEKIFFHSHEYEESYIEPTLPDDFLDISSPDETLLPKEETSDTFSGATSQPPIPVSQDVLDEFRQKAREKKQEEVFLFSYIPTNFFPKAQPYQSHAEAVLNKNSIISKIQQLSVEMYEETGEVRGRMKQRTIQMFGVTQMPESEFLSVFIHELSHYLDIYFFSRSGFGDTSEKFYDISWESTTILRSGQEKTDFVSGYSMTNKYEDFAESFTYYILHNDDFALKAEQSEKLRQKYDFFGTYLFFQGEFIGTDFSQNQEVQDYYWDITKILPDMNKFLQYIENPI